MLHTRQLAHCLWSIQHLWRQPMSNLRADLHLPCYLILRSHTHTHQAAADYFNEAWVDGWFLELKVKEGGHHIWKERRKSKGSVCPLQLLFPKPGTLSHGRWCTYFSLAQMPPGLQERKKPPFAENLPYYASHFMWSPLPQAVSSRHLTFHACVCEDPSSRHHPSISEHLWPLPFLQKLPPSTLVWPWLLPCTPGLGSRSSGPSPGPCVWQGLTPGWLMHCRILSSRVEAKARASSAKRRRPSSVNFQRHDRGREQAPPCMLTGTFSKLSRKQRLWRTVFFQPSGAVRKKGKCCLWTWKNSKVRGGLSGRCLSSRTLSPRGQEPSALLSRWWRRSWPTMRCAD